eukprot:GHVR01081606.1.p2 GENE.GHVR01081606.1~~GHVR01081606.1.p2  ORF type:complete len:114 (+),score=18.80 GHVR01081606.1:370-711(+)
MAWGKPPPGSGWMRAQGPAAECLGGLLVFSQQSAANELGIGGEPLVGPTSVHGNFWTIEEATGVCASVEFPCRPADLSGVHPIVPLLCRVLTHQWLGGAAVGRRSTPFRREKR